MANEKRLIDANALKDRFKLRIAWLEKDKHDEYTTGIWDGCLYDAKLIDEAPTVDAVEVVPGRWIDEECEMLGVRMIRRKCGECGRYEWQPEPYCHCGAKMDGDGNG